MCVCLSVINVCPLHAGASRGWGVSDPWDWSSGREEYSGSHLSTRVTSIKYSHTIQEPGSEWIRLPSWRRQCLSEDVSGCHLKLHVPGFPLYSSCHRMTRDQRDLNTGWLTRVTVAVVEAGGLLSPESFKAMPLRNNALINFIAAYRVCTWCLCI